MSDMHTFLFSPPKDISPVTSRRVHLRRLYDVLHLSVQRGDLHRARRAWAILARCKEVDWKASSMLAVGLLDHPGLGAEPRIDYLRSMMLHSSENRESILCELVHSYILAGRHREALDELEFSLPSFPYHDNALLHIYAGLCSAFISQSGVEPIDSEMLDRALIFFERAKSLDPENLVVDSLLNMAQNMAQGPPTRLQTEASDDETGSGVIMETAPVKRQRV